MNFAPAEGNIPTCILKDDDWDINSFPNLYPTGQNKMFQEREIKLTPQQFLTQRFKNKNTRFVQCTPYVFASAAYLEEKQMERNIGVSFRKGKVNVSTDGSKTYKLEDAYSVLDDVKSTPKFWKKAKMEILGKIDNFGPFHCTLCFNKREGKQNVTRDLLMFSKYMAYMWLNAKSQKKNR